MSLLPDFEKSFHDRIDAKRFELELRLSETKADTGAAEEIGALEDELAQLSIAVSEMHAGSVSATERLNDMLGLHGVPCAKNETSSSAAHESESGEEDSSDDSRDDDDDDDEEPSDDGVNPKPR
jgi:hypothetical protein